ncbi:MAG: hypothetical protein ACLP50_22090, partial [Solirubrobacteraceae bacterium]
MKNAGTSVAKSDANQNPGVLCLAGGTNDVLASTDGGQTWFAQSIAGPIADTPTSFSCPAHGVCIGGTAGGAVISSTNATSGTSGTWSAPVPAAGGVSAVGLSPQSCRFTSLCVATDGVGRILTSSDPAGGASSWSAGIADPGRGLVAADCPSVALCVAVDNGPSGTNNSDVLVSTDPAGGASHWSSPAVIDSDNLINQLQCPSASLCVSTDDDGDVLDSTNPAGSAPYWSKPQSVDESGLDLLECPTIGLCVATDEDGDVAWSTDPSGGATKWSSGTIDDNSITELQCPGAALCVATDNSGDVLDSPNPGGGTSTWSGATVIDANGVNQLQCPSASLCVATDVEGDVLESTNPGGGGSTWSAPKSIDSDGIYRLECISSSLCVATDLKGDVLVSTDPAGGASSWSSPASVDPGGGGLTSVACPSAQSCVLADQQGNVLYGTTASPGVVTGAASGVSQSAATVNASVDPEGVAVTSCELQWGTSTAYGNSEPCAQAVGSGDSPVAVSAALSGLSPGATYHFRAAATNGAGTAYGSDATFTTAVAVTPIASTSTSTSTSTSSSVGLGVTGAPSVSESEPAVSGFSGVVLSGSVVPNGVATTAEFEYGLDPRYSGGGPVVYDEV